MLLTDIKIAIAFVVIVLALGYVLNRRDQKASEQDDE